MRAHAVGMAQLEVSADPEVELVAQALGSCVALVLWDPRSHVGGMLHYMLPLAARCPDRAREVPTMFGDLGIPLLFAEMERVSGRRRGLVVKAAGGASRMDDKGIFDIGGRNCLVLRKLLWRFGVVLDGSDLGGTETRTVRLRVGTGYCTVRTDGIERAL